ncbi:restriction endonuclease subunit S [Novosphingobium sp.]|uniref:restriction endonuclease subunit S n=1 Tax=Novosphingobium sp. TaxID=1874826 RepID=UPI0031D1ED7C
MSGNVPKGWREVRIGQIAREISNRNRTSADIPVLSMTKHRGFVRSNEYFSKSVYSENTDRYKIVKRGQFAYATIHLDEGSIDYLKNEDAGLISPMYTVFETDCEEIDPEIALRKFKRFALSGRFDPYSNGGVNRRKSILFRDLSAFKFALPPLAEQYAIAEIFSTVEEAIATSEAVCVQLHEMTEALAEALFLGIDPCTGHKKVDGWRTSTLASEMASIQVGIVVKPASYYVEVGGVPALRSLNVRPNRLYLGELVKISEHGHRLNRKSALRVGDVVTVRTGEPGKTAVVPHNIGEINCIDVIFSRPGSEVRGEYVSFFMNSRIAKRQIAVLQGGLAQQHLNVGEMKRIQIRVPPLARQDQIVGLLKGAWSRIEAEEATLKKLISLRASLSQELLSGRIRLPESIIARHRNKAGRAA